MSENKLFNAASSRGTSTSNSSSSNCDASNSSDDEENNVSSSVLVGELRREVMRFYRAQYKHDIIVSLWETYRAFLANHSDQTFLQEVDDAIEGLKHISQEEAICAISKYRKLSSLYNQQAIAFDLGYRLCTKLRR